MARMTPQSKRKAGLAAAVVVLAVFAFVLMRWALSKPHTHLQYMVAGTLAISILLAAAFAQVLRRGPQGRTTFRIVRRSERSS
jgi:hypothetical protein